MRVSRHSSTELFLSDGLLVSRRRVVSESKDSTSNCTASSFTCSNLRIAIKSNHDLVHSDELCNLDLRTQLSRKRLINRTISFPPLLECLRYCDSFRCFLSRGLSRVLLLTSAPALTLTQCLLLLGLLSSSTLGNPPAPLCLCEQHIECGEMVDWQSKNR